MIPHFIFEKYPDAIKHELLVTSRKVFQTSTDIDFVSMPTKLGSIVYRARILTDLDDQYTIYGNPVNIDILTEISSLYLIVIRDYESFLKINGANDKVCKQIHNFVFGFIKKSKCSISDIFIPKTIKDLMVFL